MVDQRNGVTELAACIGKHRHDSMEGALKEVASSRKRNCNRHDLPIRAYKCPFCPGYHVGHSKDARR